MTTATPTRAAEVVRRCRVLAGCSEEPGVTTRTFLSPPMRDVHAHVTEWMAAASWKELEANHSPLPQGTF